MMQLARIRQYRQRGFTTAEIAAIAEVTPVEIEWIERRGDIENYPTLQTLARRLLARMPHWWDGTEASWQHCVRMNFCDVLPAEAKV